MKVLLYFEAQKQIAQSGIGRAMKHQINALVSNGIQYTLNPKDDFDILHINTVGFKSEKIIKKARKKNVPVIYHAHSTEEDFKNSFIFSNAFAPLFKRRIIKLYSSADLIITPTEYSKKLIENYGIKKEIINISNGIDLGRFKPSKTKVEKFRNFFNIKENEKVIFGVGLYFERKGILDFISVAQKNPDLKFIWFGHTNKLLVQSKIKKAIKNAPENVIFPGYIKGDIIEGAFLGADLFFFPSNEETEGIVVLEALAAKQKVLIRDIGVYDGWLTSGLNCYKGSNVDEFSELITDILSGNKKSTQDEGYEVAKNLTVDKVGKKLVENYIRIIDTHE